MICSSVYRLFFIQNPPVYITRELQLPLVEFFGGRSRQAEKLGAFVNSTCNNVLLEYYRSSSCQTLIEDKASEQEYPDFAADTLAVLISHEIHEQIQRTLDKLSERDRRLVKEVMLEDRSKDEVCKELKVDREYLRVLLHRAKQSFKAEYLRGAHV
jgi:RNA polymerase sigma-70 factor (ECF subfamily)